jgi:hypothetical protein
MGNEESVKSNGIATIHAIGEYINTNSGEYTKKDINMQKSNTTKPPVSTPKATVTHQQITPKQQVQQNGNLKNSTNNVNKEPVKPNGKPAQSQQSPQVSKNAANNNNNNNNQKSINDPRNLSSNSQDSMSKIVKRQLWWHESESDKRVPLTGLPKFEAGPKVDDKSSWSPSRSVKRIETRKLDWKAQPVLNTKENLNYTPGGGNKRYPSEQLEWNATHKIDTGFLYEFE